MDKVIIVTSNIAPYRLKWAEELANFHNVIIVYTKDHDFERDDRWLKTSSKKCELIKLKNSNSHDPLCFDVINIIKNNINSVFIFDGYGPKTNLLGLVYCRLKHLKVIVNVDGFPTERKKNVFKESLKRIIIKNFCPYIFCGGENVKDYLVRYGKNERDIIVHNFSSISEKEILSKVLSKEEKNSIRRELNICCNTNIILAVGRFLPLKRFDDLILAFKKCHSNCELYFIGGKPSNNYLKLANNDERIHFIDFVLPENIYKYYEMANVFVLPSETDVWGLVINEAMAKGLPIIASDSVVASKNLINGNGYIFKTYDIDELCKYIDLCLEPTNNEKMSNRSLQIIKDYTIEGMVKKQLPTISNLFKL